MKKHMLALMMVFGIGSVILAQNAPTKNGSSEEKKEYPRIERMKRELNLTESQTASITAIHEKYRPQRQAMKEGGITEDEKAKFQELRDSEMKEIMVLLTTEQQEKFKKMEAEHRQRPNAKKAPQPEEKPTPSTDK